MANEVAITLRINGDKVVVEGVNKVSASLDGMGLSATQTGAKTEAGMGAARRGVQSISTQLEKLQGLAAGYIGFTALTALAKQATEASLQIDRMTRTVEFASSSAKAFAQNTDYIKTKVGELGLNLVSAGTAFSRLSAAAKATTLEGAGARSIFDSVAKASTVMGLSAEDTAGSLLAISQMISKGTVSAEELRGQLGERLPGAFQMAARAMGVTTAELGNMLQTGSVASEVFLPRFAAQMRTEMAGSVEKAADSVQANLNRVATSWVTLQTTINNSNFTNELLKGVDTALVGITDALNSQKDEWPRLANMVAKSMAFAADAVQGTWATLQGMGREVKGIYESTSLWLKRQAALVADSQLTGGKNQAAIKKQFDAEQTALDDGYNKDMTRIYAGLDKFRVAVDAEIAARKDRANRLALDGRARSAIRAGDGVQAFNDEELLRTKVKQAESTKAAEDAAKAAAKGMALYNDLLAKNDGFTAGFAEQVISLTKAKLSAGEYSTAVALLLAQQPQYLEAAKAEENAIQATAKARADFVKAGEAGVASTEKELQQAQDAYTALVQSTDGHTALKSVLEEEQLTRLRLLATTMEQHGEDASYVLQQIENQKKLIGVLQSTEVLAASNKAADELAKANKKAAEESAKYWEDALMRAFESGKGFFQSLWDTIKNTLKTQVLKVMVSATGMTAMSGASAGETSGILGAASGASSILSLTENVGKLANAFNGSGLAEFAKSGIGQNLGLSQAANVPGIAETGASLTTAGNFFAGLPLGGMLTAYSMGGIKGFATGVASTALAGGVGAAIAGGSFMAGAGAALTAIPGWGWAAMGVAALLGMGNSGPSAVGTGEASKTFDASGKVIGSSSYAPYGGANASTESVITSLQAGYASAAAATGIKMAQAQFATGSNVASDGSYRNFAISSGVGGVSYASGETAYSEQAVKLAASRAVFSALQGSELPKYLQGAFDGLTASGMTQEQIDAWLQGAQAIKGFNDAMQVTPWENFKSLTYAAIQNLAGFAGGIDKLQTSLGSFYENFYTADVKTANLTAHTAKAFEALGITMPAVDGATRGWYRSVVEAQLALDQSIPGNAAVTNSMLALQDAVNKLAPAFDNAATSAKALAQSAFDALTKAIDAEKARITITRNLAQEQVTAITSVFDTLKTNVTALYASVTSTAAMQAGQGNAFIDNALGNAQATGYLPDNAQLADAITAARGGVDAAVYASQQDADFARLELAGRLDQLKTISGDQLTGAQQALKIAQSQLDALDTMATTAKAQLDAFNGISSMVQDIGTALGSFKNAVGGGGGVSVGGAINYAGGSKTFDESGGVSVGGASAPAAAVPHGYRTETYLGTGYGSTFAAVTDPAQVSRLDSIKAYINTLQWGNGNDAASIQATAAAAAQYGVTQQDLASAMGLPYLDVRNMFSAYGIPAFAAGGSYGGGVALVGERGPELINFAQPAQIYNAGQTQSLMGGNTARLEALVEGLTKEVQRLQQIVNNGNGSNDRIASAIEGNQSRPILVEIAA